MKSSAAETDRRVNAICELLVRSFRPHQIRRVAAEKWGLSERQTDRLTARARIILKEDLSFDRHEFVAQKLQSLDEIARRSLESGQLAVAVGAIKTQLSILGLDSPNQNGNR